MFDSAIVKMEICGGPRSKKVFSFMDDLSKRKMSEASMMMAGSKLKLEHVYDTDCLTWECRGKIGAENW